MNNEDQLSNVETLDSAVYGIVMAEIHIIKRELNSDIPKDLRVIREVELNLLEKILNRATRVVTDTE
jgi:hypothetical protein